MSETGFRQTDIAADIPIETLIEAISPLRLGTYLKSAGHNHQRALDLYLWNAKAGEAFHLPVQAAEVALRNRVSGCLLNRFGPAWWHCREFTDVANAKTVAKIKEALGRLNRDRKPVEHGRLVAELSFGYWVSLLDKRFNATIWTSDFKVAFPDTPPDLGRSQLQDRARQVVRLRNRIDHHEPIFGRDLSKDHSECLELVYWMCPAKADWIRPHCRLPRLLRDKP